MRPRGFRFSHFCRCAVAPRPVAIRRPPVSVCHFTAPRLPPRVVFQLELSTPSHLCALQPASNNAPSTPSPSCKPLDRRTPAVPASPPTPSPGPPPPLSISPSPDAPLPFSTTPPYTHTAYLEGEGLLAEPQVLRGHEAGQEDVDALPAVRTCIVRQGTAHVRTAHSKHGRLHQLPPQAPSRPSPAHLACISRGALPGRAPHARTLLHAPPPPTQCPETHTAALPAAYVTPRPTIYTPSRLLAVAPRSSTIPHPQNACLPARHLPSPRPSLPLSPPKSCLCRRVGSTHAGTSVTPFLFSPPHPYTPIPLSIHYR